MKPSLYIGLMSGTSMDGICATLVDLSSNPPVVIASIDQTYPQRLAAQLNAMISPDWTGSLSKCLDVDVEVGRAFAQATLAVIAKAGCATSEIVAIGHHGQTLWHQPESDTPSSLQIGDPNIIAEATKITVVADFRRRDIAAGGQGAPLTPAFHRHCFGNNKAAAVLNLGGIANLTILDSLLGFDSGPANTLLDTWCYKCTGNAYDDGGRWARSGNVDGELLEAFLNEPYFHRQAPKSTGRETFNLQWIENKLQGTSISNEGIQATLTELTAQSVYQALTKAAPETQKIIICGGGIHNSYLIERIQASAENMTVVSSSIYGIDPDQLEAIAFAWLAQQTLEGTPGNIPAATGASGSRVLGCIYHA